MERFKLEFMSIKWFFALTWRMQKHFNKLYCTIHWNFDDFMSSLELAVDTPQNTPEDMKNCGPLDLTAVYLYSNIES
jgi:hypothetical protein